VPIPLTALFAATLQQIRSAASDPAALARAADLLARAAGPGPSTWEVESNRLLVNGVPIPNGAPGVAIVRAVLTRHHIRELTVPGQTDASHWSELATALDSATGLYRTAEQFTHALQAAVPGTDVRCSIETFPEAGDADEINAATSQRTPVSAFAEPAPGLVSETADRAALSVRLEPLIEAGMAAATRWDWDGIAAMLLQLHALEEHANDAERWIIAQERHRVVSPSMLQRMVRELPTLSPGAPLSRGIASLGGEAVEAILEALADDPSRQGRHSYIAALESIANADAALLEALTASVQTNVLRDVIAVVGRRRIEGAIPTLAALRHNGDERVRTAALRALENIGTPAAIAALR
jgi:hypothetical protein